MLYTFDKIPRYRSAERQCITLPAAVQVMSVGGIICARPIVVGKVGRCEPSLISLSQGRGQVLSKHPERRYSSGCQDDRTWNGATCCPAAASHQRVANLHQKTVSINAYEVQWQLGVSGPDKISGEQYAECRTHFLPGMGFAR